MNLSKKRKLAKRTLNIGEDRLVFLESRLAEIKEAITKQDIRDLLSSGAIIIKERKGRRGVQKEKSRSAGNVRKKIKKRKRGYIILTRKFRNYLKQLKTERKITKEKVKDIRKKIKNRYFKNMAHLKEGIMGVAK